MCDQISNVIVNLYGSRRVQVVYSLPGASSPSIRKSLSRIVFLNHRRRSSRLVSSWSISDDQRGDTPCHIVTYRLPGLPRPIMRIIAQGFACVALPDQGAKVRQILDDLRHFHLYCPNVCTCRIVRGTRNTFLYGQVFVGLALSQVLELKSISHRYT
jgi:hypothetical protein